MSITVTTDVFCDGEDCSQWTHGVTGPRLARAYARLEARSAGWHCTIKGDYCPDCWKRKLNERAGRDRA